jgi:NAD(P)-dependent dehydrogenase (short-subunit alcohol dehydrogenase family)
MHSCPLGSSPDARPGWVNAGHDVVATTRNVSSLHELADTAPGRVLTVELDVTDAGQVSRAVQQADDRFGGVDVLVNNAGYGYRAAVEEGDDADVRLLFDTHVFGAVAMIKAVLPGMRARRSGAIVNVSSIGAQITPVGSGYYSAAKAALEGLSGALHGELAPLGISVTIVEPGAFRTDFAGRSLTQSATVIDDYADTAGKRREEHDADHGTQAGDPATAATAIIDAVETDTPPGFLLLGSDAPANFRRVNEARLAEVATWENLTKSTDYTD